MAERVARGAADCTADTDTAREYPVERIYRDARLMTIGEGTSEIQRLVIGGCCEDKHTYQRNTWSSFHINNQSTLLYSLSLSPLKGERIEIVMSTRLHVFVLRCYNSYR